MSALARRFPAVPRFPWRLATALALLLLAAILAVLIAGAGRARIPAPFGPAANGQIVLLDGSGRILTADPDTGQTRVVIDKPGNGRPIYSQDGTRLAFMRTRGSGFDLYVANADGSNERMLNAVPMETPAYLGWSPRGDYLIVSRETGTLERYDTSKQGPATVLAGDLANHQVVIGYGGFNDRSAGLFRPPNGEELLVVSSGADGLKLRAVHPDGTGARDLLSHETTDLAYTGLKSAQWSPDGSQVVVMVTLPPGEGAGWNHLYIVNADGTDLHPLNVLSLDLLIDEGSPMWSPDGAHIAFMRWTTHADGSLEDFHPLAIADVAAGTYLDVGRVSNNGYKSWEWSPDGASILAVPDDGTNDVLIIDAATGTFETAPWQASDAVSWQRTAP